MCTSHTKRTILGFLGDSTLVFFEERPTLDPVDHRFTEVIVSHHVINLVLSLFWVAMSRDFKRLSQVVRGIAPVYVVEAYILALLCEWNLKMILRE